VHLVAALCPLELVTLSRNEASLHTAARLKSIVRRTISVARRAEVYQSWAGRAISSGVTRGLGRPLVLTITRGLGRPLVSNWGYRAVLRQQYPLDMDCESVEVRQAVHLAATLCPLNLVIIRV